MRVDIRTNNRGKGGGKFVGVFIGVMFVLVPTLLLSIALGGIRSYQDAKDWPAVSAIVTKSELETKHSSKSTTYKPKISYRYQFNGRTYESGRYSFFEISSSSRSRHEAVVRAHPAGKQIAVYVNPKHPDQAVINRGITGEVIFVVGFCSVFVLIGLGLLYATLFRSSASAGARSKSAGFVRPERSSGYAPSGEVVLAPSFSRKAKLFGALLVALFWNGIVSVFLYQAVESAQRGRPEWGLMIFLVPFVVIGLGLIGLVIYVLLGSFNPAPTLYLDKAEVEVGGTLNVRWTFTGRIERIQELTLQLEGHERAQYRRGTDTHTDYSVFYTKDIVRTAGAGNIGSGSVKVMIPEPTMHTFDSGNNSIGWVIKVKGVIEGWPDVSDEFPITVTPRRAGQAPKLKRTAVDTTQETPWGAYTEV